MKASFSHCYNCSKWTQSGILLLYSDDYSELKLLGASSLDTSFSQHSPPAGGSKFKNNKMK
jgi:hypothetical protein